MNRSSQSRKTLSPRERLCILLPALYALGRREEALAVMRTAITKRQTPRTFFAELFIHLSLLIGFPNMLDGLEKLAHVQSRVRHAPSDRLSPSQLRKRGLRALHRVYGTQAEKLLRSLAAVHADLPRMIVEDVYGRVIARAGLTIAERELVNMTVLTIQGLHRQLYSHIRGALRVGIPPGVLRTVLRILKSKFRVRIDEAEKSLDRLTASQN